MDKHSQKIIKIAQKAMKMSLPIELEYDGIPRLCEVHAIGISKTGRPSLRVYQTTTDSVSGDGPGWKLLTIGKIFDPPKLVDMPNMAPRDGYSRGDKGLIEIIEEL